MNRPPVVLLCGGLGLRQRSDVDDTAKPLRPLVDGRALVLHVIDHYRSYGFTEFVLCTGYGADTIREVVERDLGDTSRLSFVDSGVDADKCARLLDARRHVGERRFLLGYADVLSDIDLDALLRVHDEGKAVMTLATADVRSRFGVVVFGAGTRVASFAEKPVEASVVSAGYFACEPGLFDELTPFADLERDVIPALAARGLLHGLRHKGFWKALDTYKDFVDVESLMLEEGAACGTATSAHGRDAASW